MSLQYSATHSIKKLFLMRYNSKIFINWLTNEFFDSVRFSLIDQNSITPKSSYKSSIDFLCVVIQRVLTTQLLMFCFATKQHNPISQVYTYSHNKYFYLLLFLKCAKNKTMETMCFAVVKHCLGHQLHDTWYGTGKTVRWYGVDQICTEKIFACVI